MPQGDTDAPAVMPHDAGSSTGTVRALVALGANLPSAHGSPARTVAAAMDALAALGPVAARSRLWRSPAWPPGRSAPDYVNAVAVLDTALAPQAALAALHAIEDAFGRVRAGRWGARLLDLDLLAMDGPDGVQVLPDEAVQAAWRMLPPDRQAVDLPAMLVLPHPRLQDRGFVLAPLAEVAPDWRHPALGLTVREMLAALPARALDGLAPIGRP